MAWIPKPEWGERERSGEGERLWIKTDYRDKATNFNVWILFTFSFQNK